MHGTPATGDRTSVSMAESTTDSATRAWDLSAGSGADESFYYNRSVTNVSVTNVTRVYNRTVVVNNTRNVSYNGGAGGIEARPTRQEESAVHERHMAPLATQSQHEHLASQNRQNFASENHGRPAIAATARPGDFSGRSAVPARAAGGEYHAPAMSPKEARGPSSPANREIPTRDSGLSRRHPRAEDRAGTPRMRTAVVQTRLIPTRLGQPRFIPRTSPR